VQNVDRSVPDVEKMETYRTNMELVTTLITQQLDCSCLEYRGTQDNRTVTWSPHCHSSSLLVDSLRMEWRITRWNHWMRKKKACYEWNYYRQQCCRHKELNPKILYFYHNTRYCITGKYARHCINFNIISHKDDITIDVLVLCSPTCNTATHF